MKMPEVQEMKEEPVEVSLERVTKETFASYHRQIRALSKNTLKKSEGKSLGERERELRGIGRFLNSSSHGELHVAVKDGKVLGFIALTRDADEKVATIEQMRIRAGSGGRSLLHGMLKDLATSLHKWGYHDCGINVKKGDKTALGKFQHDSWFTKMYGINEIELGDEEEGPIEEVDVMDDEEEGAMKEAA